MHVASLLDLLATKVILQRIEAKDYQDIAAILRVGKLLQDGLAGAAALYSPSFQPSEAVKALTYFEGGDLAINLSPEDREYWFVRLLMPGRSHLGVRFILPCLDQSVFSVTPYCAIPPRSR